MGKILRDMTEQELISYEEDSKKFPWLKTIKMSDDKFELCLERDRGKGMTALLFHRLLNKHYSWVFLAIIKHFYQTGEFVNYDRDYMDSQTEFIIQGIMQAWGADHSVISDVLDGKAKFDFSKYKAPTEVPACDDFASRLFGHDEQIFKDYYESHGFQNPF